MYCSHSIQRISGMDLLISLCDSMTGVCKASKLKQLKKKWPFVFLLGNRLFFWYKLSTLLHIVCAAYCSCAALVCACAADKESKQRYTGRSNLPPATGPILVLMLSKHCKGFAAPL